MAGVPPWRIEAAIVTLGDLSSEDWEQLDGSTRDELSHLRFVLEEILEAKRAAKGPTPLMDVIAALE